MKEIYNAIEALGKYLGLDSAAVVILLVLPLGLIYLRFKYTGVPTFLEGSAATD